VEQRFERVVRGRREAVDDWVINRTITQQAKRKAESREQRREAE